MIRLLPADGTGIRAAVSALGEGRLVLHPTETVASLTGDPYHPGAVAAARRLKGYDEPRPFLCLVADEVAARGLAAPWPEAARLLAEALWPGPLTLVVPASAEAPAPVVAAGGIALRPAGDPVSLALLAEWRGPLFSTSANPRGEAPPVGVEEAARALEGVPGSGALALGLVGDGRGAGGEPSTVVDTTVDPPRILRPGAVSRERLERIVPGICAGPPAGGS